MVTPQGCSMATGCQELSSPLEVSHFKSDGLEPVASGFSLVWAACIFKEKKRMETVWLIFKKCLLVRKIIKNGKNRKKKLYQIIR